MIFVIEKPKSVRWHPNPFVMLRNFKVNLFAVLALILLMGVNCAANAQSPTAEFFANDTIVCIGNTVSFTDLSTPGGSSISSWSWNFGDGGISASQNPNYLFANGGNFTVTLIITDAVGAKDTVTHGIYVLKAQAVQNIVRVCAPQNTTTIAAIDPNIAGVTGVWFTASGALIASPVNDTTSVSNLNAGSYTFYWVVSDGSCSDADQVTVFVDQPVNVNAGADQQICSSLSTTTMAGSNPSPGIGLWSTSSAAFIANSSIRNTTISGLTSAGTYVFVWTVTNGSCVTRDTMQIVVSDPVTSIAGSDQTVCSIPGTVLLAGNNPSPGVGLWSTSSSVIISTPSSPSSSVSSLIVAGAYNFIWTITNGACINRDTMQIVVSTPITSNAGNNIQVCTSTATGTLNGNNPSPGVGLWTALNGGVITSPSSSTTTVTGLNTAGFYNFVWTITNGACITRDTVAFIVRVPVIANAGLDQSFCNLNGATLTGNSPLPGTGTWTTTGPVFIASPSSAITNVSGLLYGNNTFVYSISYGACVTRDTVIIHIDNLITANAGADQQICDSQTSVSLIGNSPLLGSGVWTNLNGGIITSPLSPITTVTGLNAGMYSFIWTITNGTCTSKDTVRIVVSPQVPSNAGLDDEVCQGGIGSLSANDPFPAIGLWTTNSSASINLPSSADILVANLTNVGVYTFVWTVTNGACVLRDTARVIVDSSIVAHAGADQSVCAATTASLSANSAIPGIGLWTSLGSATILNATNSSATAQNLTYGNNSFVWTITNGLCTSKDTVIIKRDSTVTSAAGSDQSVCAGSPITLTGNSPLPGTGIWNALSGGTITFPISATTTITGLSTAGAYNFVWTITNGSCVSRDTVRITVSSTVVANAGADQGICASTTATLSGNASAPGIGAWTSLGTAIVTNPSSANSGVTSLANGANAFVWTITNGACVTRDTILITVSTLVISAAGSDQSVCAGSPITLTGNSPLPGTGIWNALSGGTITFPISATTTITGLSTAGAYNFVWIITNGSCVSRDTVRITVSNIVVPNTGNDIQLCNTFITILNSNNPAPGIGIWTSPSGATIASPFITSTNVSDMIFGDNTFVWTITNGSCVASDTIHVFVDSVKVAVAGTDQTICSGSALVLVANDPSPGTGVWTTTSSAVFADSSQATTTAVGLSIAGTYDLIWTITNGVCVSSDTIKIIADSNNVAVAGPDQQLCETITTTSLSATATTIGTGVWSTNGSANIANVNDPATSVSGLVIGNNIFIWTITSGTCITKDSINVVISQETDTAHAGSDQQICASLGLVMVSGNVPLIGTGSWSSLGAAVVDAATSVTTTVSNLSIGSNLFVYTITNGACSSSDTLDVNVFAKPTIDAGNDQFITSGTPVTIGGSPVASGGSAPYTYSWIPGTLLNDSLIANPLATVIVTTTFVVNVTDSVGCNAQDSIIVWVNDPLVLENDTLAINEDSTVVIFPLLNDTDPDNNINAGTLAILNGPFNGTATINTLTGTITYIPNANYYGQDSIMYTLCDSGMPVYCDTAWIYITLNPVNDAPFAIDDFDTTVKDSCIQIAVLANDWDIENAIIVGSLITFNGPSYGTISLDTLTGIITYCPDSNFAGVDTFYYAICDSGYPAPGLCDTAMVIITVNSKNYFPVALNDSVLICANDSIIIDVRTNDIDPDGDPLSISISLVPSHGNATVDVLGNILFIPDLTFAGFDSLQYSVCDNQSPAGCDTAWLFIDVKGVPLLSSVTTNNKCFQDSIGTIDLTIIGNVGFLISWNNGAVVEDLDSLTTGIYTVTVVDTFGCRVTLTDTVYGPVLPLSASLSLQPVYCYADSSGAIDLQPSGGTSPYYFSWSNGSADEDIDSLIAGVYTIILSDTNGCQLTLTDTILQPASALTASLYVTDVKCMGDSSGSILVIPAGGTSAYSYLWNNGAVVDSATSIPVGLYSVIITDSHNCSITVADSVMALHPAVKIDTLVVQPNCLANILGSVEVIAVGGLLPFQYSWSTSDTISLVDSLSTGSYSVLVTDANGCSKSCSAILTDTSIINIQVTGALSICSGDSVVLTATNSAYVSYQWTNTGSPMTDTLNTITVHSSGDYAVTATAICGQFNAGPLTVVVNALPIASVDPDMTVHCDSLVELTATGGNTYLWSPSNLVSDSLAAIVIVQLQQTDTIVVTAISAEGCASNDTIVLTVNCDTLFIPTGFSPNNDGVNDYFVISNIDEYPNANLKIFNRWGDLVYTKEHYDNSWNGLSNTDMIRMGNVLPNGTYYYVFDPRNGENGKAGYVILRR